MTTTASGGGTSSSGTDWTGAVLAGLGSMFAANSASSAASAKTKDEYMWSARLMRYRTTLDDYYKLRDRQEMRNAAGEYGKFSTLDQWAPGYSQTYQPLQAPNRPPQGDEIYGSNANSYYADYSGGINTGIPGGTRPGSATSLDPLGNSGNGVAGDLDDWRNQGGGG